MCSRGLPSAPSRWNETPGAANLQTRNSTAIFQRAHDVEAQRLSGNLKGDALRKAGEGLSDFLAEGIEQGLIKHDAAIALRAQALGLAATNGVKKGAKVHSPSRATMWTGTQIGTGLAIGMRQTHGDIDRASSALGARAVASRNFSRVASAARGEAGGSSGRGGGGKILTIGRVENHINAPSGVTDATAITAHALSITLERFQLMDGG